MFTQRFSRRRPKAQRPTTDRSDRRSGAPVRLGPEPMPRMRWYR